MELNEETIRSFVNYPRDKARENTLKRELRLLPESERFAFIQKCFDITGYRIGGLGLILTNSCLQSKSYIIPLLEKGLIAADASTIKFWLEFTVTKLGERKTFAILFDLLETKPEVMGKALYWLPSLLKTESEMLAELLRLKTLAEAKVVTRKSVIIPDPTNEGRVLFGNIYADEDT
jgi:hypothetical protein